MMMVMPMMMTIMEKKDNDYEKEDDYNFSE